MNDPGDAGEGAPGPAIGAEFAGHRVEAVIGRGGMGVVYRARNLALDRERALKVLAPALSRDERFRERFRRESRLAASIEHPNVIGVHQAGEEQGQLYISMRLVEGDDLRALVDAEGPLVPAAAVGIVSEIAAALDAAHDAGLIHRDVKPANVLVGSGADAGRVYLTDFGISRTARAGETVTATGEIVGTADFIAPEQIAGEPVDGRADIYALGAVLHFALTGHAPFPRENELATLFAHANAPRPRPSEVRPGLPPGLDAVVAKAMAVRPEDRYPTAGEFSAALAGTLAGVTDEPTRPLAETPTRPLAEPATRGSRRLAIVAAVGGAVAAVVAVVVVLAGGNGGAGSGSGDPAQPTASAPIEVGQSPSGITVGDLRTWVAVNDENQVAGINPATDEVAPRVQVPGAKSVAVGLGSIWAVSSETDSLYRIDPAEAGSPQPIALGPGAEPSDVAVDDRWVWITAEGTNQVVRFDPQVGELRTEQVGVSPRALAVDAASVWVTNIDDGTVSEIDRLDVKRVESTIEVGGRPSDIAVGEGGVWVIDNLNGTLTKIEPGSGPGTPMTGLVQPRGVKTGFGYVWVANGGADTVVRVDPADPSIVGEPIAVGDNPADIAIGEGSVWTANAGDGTVTRLNP